MDKVDKAIDLLISEEESLFSNPLVFDDAWLDEHIDGTWTRKDDGTIDVVGNVYLPSANLKEIPFQFGEVTGEFSCSMNRLTSLKGSPRKVGGSFYCTRNDITSLEGGPEWVDESYFCDANEDLYSLKGAPKHVGVFFRSSRYTDDQYRKYAERVYGKEMVDAKWMPK